MNQIKDCPLCGYPDIIEDDKSGLVKCIVCGAEWELQPNMDKNVSKDYYSTLDSSAKDPNLFLRLLEYKNYIRFNNQLPIELVPENKNDFKKALLNSLYTHLRIHFIGETIKLVRIESNKIKDIDKFIVLLRKNKTFAGEAWKEKGIVAIEIEPVIK